MIDEIIEVIGKGNGHSHRERKQSQGKETVTVTGKGKGESPNCLKVRSQPFACLSHFTAAVIVIVINLIPPSLFIT